MKASLIVKACLILGVALAVMLAGAPGAKAAPFDYDAPAAQYGPWQTLDGPTFSRTYTISYGTSPVKNAVLGQVDYFDVNGNEVIDTLHNEYTFTTFNGASAVKVRFIGVPYATHVSGSY